MSVSCAPNDLASGAIAFRDVPVPILLEIQTYLLCQIVNKPAGGGTGGSAIFTGNFANPNGNVTPTTLNAGALYYQDTGGALQFWAWSVSNQNWFPLIGG